MRQGESQERVSSEGEKNNSQSGFDALVARSAEVLARNTVSRRNFLNRVAKLALAITGASLVQVLPIDRELLDVDAAAADCDTWNMCGIYTPRVCSCACGANSCPGGTTSGTNPWYACCFNGSSWWSVAYFDCCYTGTPPSCCSVSSCDCYKGPRQTLWCGGVPGGSLCCTRWAIQEHC